MKKKLLIAGLAGMLIGLCAGCAKKFTEEEQEDNFDETDLTMDEISEPTEHKEAEGPEMPGPKEHEEAKELDIPEEIKENEDLSDKELTDTLAEEADQKEVEADKER